MSLREWLLRKAALDAQERADWRRTLAVVNTVRGIMGADPIEMGATPKRTQKDSDTDALDAMKWRHREWWDSPNAEC